MTDAEHKARAQQDKAQAMARVIMATAREYATPAREVFPTNDTEWFRVWRMAKCASAPSEQTKALCREFVDQLVQLEEVERARVAAWCGVCDSTGIEQDDDGRWPCTESKHEAQS